MPVEQVDGDESQAELIMDEVSPLVCSWRCSSSSVKTRRCRLWDPGKVKRRLQRDLVGAFIGDLIGDEGER